LLVSPSLSLLTFFLSSSAHPRDLHSFPTRRSSDLQGSQLHVFTIVDGVPRHVAAVKVRGRSASTYDYGQEILLQGNRVIYLATRDRKSTRLNSSHSQISYAVFCLKKKKKKYNYI